MHLRQPLPRVWMMTDERQGDALLPAVEKLPEEAGIVFRHYSLDEEERRLLFGKVRGISGPRILMLAGSPETAAAWGADGSHGWEGQSRSALLRSVSVHDLRETDAANELPADFVFASPVFETRSHPVAKTLGPAGLAAIAARAEMPVIALGGMNAERAESLGRNIHGWAGIDAWA